MGFGGKVRMMLSSFVGDKKVALLEGASKTNTNYILKEPISLYRKSKMTGSHIEMYCAFV